MKIIFFILIYGFFSLNFLIGGEDFEEFKNKPFYWPLEITLDHPFPVGPDELVSLKAEGKILVGIVTHEQLNYRRILKVADQLMEKYSFLIVGCIDHSYIKEPYISFFDGLILPGGISSYASYSEPFSWKEMDADKRIVLENLYQLALYYSHIYEIPLLGICAGAQHIVLSQGGKLHKVKNKSDDKEPISLLAGTIAYFMALSKEEQLSALEICHLPDILLYAKRMHNYAAVPGFLGSLELGGSSRLGIPMVFSYAFWQIGFQPHIESHYENNIMLKNETNERATHVFDNFLRLCFEYSELKKEASNDEVQFFSLLDSRREKYNKILERLKSCATFL